VHSPVCIESSRPLGFAAYPQPSPDPLSPRPKPKNPPLSPHNPTLKPSPPANPRILEGMCFRSNYRDPTLYTWTENPKPSDRRGSVLSESHHQPPELQPCSNHTKALGSGESKPPKIQPSKKNLLWFSSGLEESYSATAFREPQRHSSGPDKPDTPRVNFSQCTPPVRKKPNAARAFFIKCNTPLRELRECQAARIFERSNGFRCLPKNINRSPSKTNQ